MSLLYMSFDNPKSNRGELSAQNSKVDNSIADIESN